MHGQGMYQWPDGRFYKGSFEKDKKHGYGIYSFPDKRCYKGEFKNGLQHGQGVFVTPDGKERQGQWFEGKRIKAGGRSNQKSDKMSDSSSPLKQ